MKFSDFIEFLKMIQDTEKEMRPSRFWTLMGLGAGAVSGWVIYALAQLIKALH